MLTLHTYSSGCPQWLIEHNCVTGHLALTWLRTFRDKKQPGLAPESLDCPSLSPYRATYDMRNVSPLGITLSCSFSDSPLGPKMALHICIPRLSSSSLPPVS